MDRCRCCGAAPPLRPLGQGSPPALVMVVRGLLLLLRELKEFVLQSRV